MRIAWYYFKRYMMYPREAISIVIRMSIGIMFIFLFWYLYGKLAHVDLKSTLGYLLVAFGTSNLVQTPGQSPYRLGRLLRKSIKSGRFSAVMMLPISVIKYMYWQSIGLQGVMIIVGVIELLIGFVLLVPTWEKVLLWLGSLIIGSGVAFAFNLFEGALTFYTTESTGIKNAITHVNRILSGKLIPLTMFPSTLKGIVLRLPFAYMAYYPAAIIGNLHIDAYVYFTWGIVWVVALNIISLVLFYRGMKYYEAVGL